MRRFFPFIFFAIITTVFFSPVLLQNKTPIPADTIVGLYHPFRDLYARDYPNGIPYKNFLITDPVRQQYPWRSLAIDNEKHGKLPLWNPYNFGGTPLLANLQSAAFYPLNILFFIIPFTTAWNILIFIQPILVAFFLYLYLRNLKLSTYASSFGAFVFAFCGFSIAWLEWGTIVHTGLWLPLILLSVDKIVLSSKYSVLSIKNGKFLFWSLVYILSLTSSFFAGHLQTFFYLSLVSAVYFFIKWWQHDRTKKIFLAYLILNTLFLILTIVQWWPTIQFILQSGRGVDQNWQKEGWFIPWQNLIQFIAPDFFGNPTTLNYWGIWNYAEFVGYIGIFPLIMAFLAIFFRKDKKTLFFGSVFAISLIFALPTIFARIPYILNIPFISTSQPTRLLFLTDFALAVLSALGIDMFVKKSINRNIAKVLLSFFIIFAGLWIYVLAGARIFGESLENLLVAKRNLVIPSLILGISGVLILIRGKYTKTKISPPLLSAFIVLVIFDLFRFGSKFTPFAENKYLFPSTKAIDFLQKQKGEFRIMSTDDRILPPNFSIMYKLQTLDGYDPLYLLSYGELMAAIKRGEPNISTPFGFNRIITPHNYGSKLIDVLGVKYVLSLSDLSSPKLKQVYREGETRIYENKQVFPRAFFVENTVVAVDKAETIDRIFDTNIDLKNTAIIDYKRCEGCLDLNRKWAKGSAKIVSYSENRIMIEAEIPYNKDGTDGFLVLMDSFYPTWHVKINNNDRYELPFEVESGIIRTNYNFRGIPVSPGKHIIEFYNTFF